MPELKKLKPRHEAIADFILDNPMATGRDIAKAFGLTPQTIYNIINSDLFRKYLAKRRDERNIAIAELREKLAAVAEHAVDKLASQLEHIDDPQLLLSIADKTLARISPARGGTSDPFTTPAQQQNIQINIVDAEAIAAARERVRRLLGDSE